MYLGISLEKKVSKGNGKREIIPLKEILKWNQINGLQLLVKAVFIQFSTQVHYVHGTISLYQLLFRNAIINLSH